MDGVVMRGRCRPAGRVQSGIKPRHDVEKGLVAHFDSIASDALFNEYCSALTHVLPCTSFDIIHQMLPLLPTSSTHHRVHGRVWESTSSLSLVAPQHQRASLMATHFVIEVMQPLSNIHQVTFGLGTIQFAPASNLIRSSAFQQHGDRSHRWPRPVQDVKKTCQEHDAPKRQVGCSQQRDRVFQSRHISSISQADNPVPIFVLLLQTFAQLGHRNRCGFIHRVCFVRAISKRQKVHASFIWTAKTLRLHTVLSRARWTPGTDGSPHSMTVPNE